MEETFFNWNMDTLHLEKNVSDFGVLSICSILSQTGVKKCIWFFIKSRLLQVLMRLHVHKYVKFLCWGQLLWPIQRMCVQHTWSMVDLTSKLTWALMTHLIRNCMGVPFAILHFFHFGCALMQIWTGPPEDCFFYISSSQSSFFCFFFLS